jgi:IS5 family transposase
MEDFQQMYNGERLQRNFQDAFWMKVEMDKNHLFVKIADNFNWDRVLGELKKFYCSNNGRPTVSTRLKVGLLIAKHLKKWSDEGVTEQLRENLYLQYLCDISPEDATRGVINESSLTYFRKQIGEEGIKIIEEEVERLLKDNGKSKGNKMTVDSTIVPENIEYPTDVHLLEKCRRKLVKVIDNACKELNTLKPRTYRNIGRKAFLTFIKFRKKGNKFRIKIQKKLIRFVHRNLNQAKELLSKVNNISDKVKQEVEVISKILNQQKQVSQGKSVKHRIVSIHKPEVRPMVKGKFPNEVEFGQKITLVKKGKGVFLSDSDNENTFDTELLDKSVEFYERKFKKKPTAVITDRGYYSAKNVKKLEEKGIKKLAIAPKGKAKPEYTKESYYKKLCRERNAIEADISLLKRKYGLDKNRYKDPNQWIRLGLIARNLKVALS